LARRSSPVCAASLDADNQQDKQHQGCLWRLEERKNAAGGLFWTVAVARQRAANTKIDVRLYKTACRSAGISPSHYSRVFLHLPAAAPSRFTASSPATAFSLPP